RPLLLALHNAQSPGASYRPSSRQPWEIAAHGPRDVVRRLAGQGLPRALQNEAYNADCWRNVIAFVLSPERVHTIAHPMHCHHGRHTGTLADFCAILLYSETITMLPRTSPSATKRASGWLPSANPNVSPSPWKQPSTPLSH